MKTIQIEIPEGKRAEWVNGVLTLVDEQSPTEPMFKIGDKAILTQDVEFLQGAKTHINVSNHLNKTETT